MAFFKRRIPPTSDMVPVFAACIFGIFSWSILIFVFKLPAWIKFLDAWSVVGILAYVLAFSFLESALVFLLLLALTVVLPATWLRDRFQAQGTLLVLVSAFWASLFQTVGGARVWNHQHLLLAALLPLASIVASALLVHRSPRLCRAMRGLAGRFTVFLYIYPPLSALSLAVILVRNVW